MLQEYMGMVNYLGYLIPHLADMVAPLTEMAGATATWDWTSTYTKAFNHIRAALSADPPVRPINYHFADQIYLVADLSLIGTGAWIGQGPTLQTIIPADFHSRKFNPAEENYSTFDKELLAIVDILEHFRSELTGCSYIILIDHKRLVSFPTQYNQTRKQCRWQQIIYQFRCKIQHIGGNKNVIADALSRVFINPSLVPSLSDFIPHSIDSSQPLPTFQAPQDFSRRFKVISSPPKGTTNNSSHRIPPITSHPTSITSVAMTRSQTKKSQSPAPSDNSPTGSIHDQYHRDRANKENSAPPAIMQTPPNNSAVEALFSLVANDPSFRPRPLRLLKHNPNNQDSILAATFRAQHVLMHYLSCGDSTCYTHCSSHLNSNRAPKDNWCAYCNRKGYYTTCCGINRQDKVYFEQEKHVKES